MLFLSSMYVEWQALESTVMVIILIHSNSRGLHNDFPRFLFKGLTLGTHMIDLIDAQVNIIKSPLSNPTVMSAIIYPKKILLMVLIPILFMSLN